MFKNNGDAKGLQLLLAHHLEECSERYKQYMQRHDELWNQLEMIERERVSKWELLRREFQESLNKQTEQMRWTVWKVVGLVGGILALLVSVSEILVRLKIP